MRRLVLSVLGVVVTVAVLAVPAQGATSVRVPPRDSVVGGGLTREGGPFRRISINAESDALGGNPNGFVDLFVQTPFGQALTINGPVTCLGVDGNRAVIGFVDTFSGFGPLTVVVSGNNPLGSQQDGFNLVFGATDCSSIPEVPLFAVFGAIAVRDVPSKGQCKDGGWRNYTDAAGQPFSDQGDCVTFALGAD